MRREPEPGTFMNFRGVSGESIEPHMRAPVLPADDGREGRARMAIPADQARALRGEAGAAESIGTSTQRGNNFGDYRLQ